MTHRYLAKPRVVFVHEKFRIVMYPANSTPPLPQLEIIEYAETNNHRGPYHHAVYEFRQNTPTQKQATNKKGWWYQTTGHAVYESNHEVWAFVDIMLEAYIEASELLGEDPLG